MLTKIKLDSGARIRISAIDEVIPVTREERVHHRGPSWAHRSLPPWLLGWPQGDEEVGPVALCRSSLAAQGRIAAEAQPPASDKVVESDASATRRERVCTIVGTLPSVLLADVRPVCVRMCVHVCVCHQIKQQRRV